MRATKILEEEHRLIERVLDSLETVSDRADAGDPVDPSFFLRAADFIKGFADGCHHEKEERILFPALEAAGLPKAGGPVVVMLEEHAEGRRLVSTMRDAAERLAAGDPRARSTLVASAREYVALLRAHIAKENHVLFPMAEQIIGAPERDEVLRAFERLERAATETATRERYEALAGALEREASR